MEEPIKWINGMDGEKITPGKKYEYRSIIRTERSRNRSIGAIGIRMINPSEEGEEAAEQ